MIAEMPSTSTATGQLLGEGIGDAELHISSSKMIDNLHGNATAAWRMVVTYRSASPTPPGVPSGLRAICDRNRLRVQCQSAPSRSLRPDGGFSIIYVSGDMISEPPAMLQLAPAIG